MAIVLVAANGEMEQSFIIHDDDDDHVDDETN